MRMYIRFQWNRFYSKNCSYFVRFSCEIGFIVQWNYFNSIRIKTLPTISFDILSFYRKFVAISQYVQNGIFITLRLRLYSPNIFKIIKFLLCNCYFESKYLTGLNKITESFLENSYSLSRSIRDFNRMIVNVVKHTLWKCHFTSTSYNTKKNYMSYQYIRKSTAQTQRRYDVLEYKACQRDSNEYKALFTLPMIWIYFVQMNRCRSYSDYISL